MHYINGNSARCADCQYFEKRYVSQNDKHDGECTNKHHLRTHIGIYTDSRTMACFDFEFKDYEPVIYEAFITD